MSYKIEKQIATKSRCYHYAQKLVPQQIFLHSVGCNQPNAEVFAKRWNRWDANVLPHFVCDPGRVIQVLDTNKRAWHAGGLGNNWALALEMCEPAGIRYISGSRFVIRDGVKKQDLVDYFEANTRTAVELFADLCIQFNLDPLGKFRGMSVIISHKEGHTFKIGGYFVATNHGDPEHMWNQLGMDWNMDRFRKEVAQMIKTKKGAIKPAPAPQAKPAGSAVIFRVQVGAFKDLSKAQVRAREMQALGFETYIRPENGWHKVQIGAFADRAKAEAMAKDAEAKYEKKYIQDLGVYIAEIETAEKSEPLNVGDTVKVTGDVYYSGTRIPGWVKAKTHAVSQLKSDRVLLGHPDGINSWLPIDGVKKI